MQQSLLKIKCAEDKKAASYYLGKKVAAIIIKKHQKKLSGERSSAPMETMELLELNSLTTSAHIGWD
eukprot:gnl/Chilomastix_caulleri/1810.p1 GENE.gnl/Chilomastix_caulleri/1810~~gnl/Chilomastix_caulleri/1810.p1  ORF type:complete len:67 (+),score=15.05 gnl/Chilomastix_caulleri/1810:504-704(+)